MILQRLFVCFDVEDPKLYCDRIAMCIKQKKDIEASLALSLYIDCMPVDGLKPLESEQVSRILTKSSNTDALRNNTALDTSTLMQQYNLNHMRSLNKMILIQLLHSHIKEIQSANPVSTDASLFSNADHIFPSQKEIATGSEVPLAETKKSFTFYSLLTKMETIRIMAHIQVENVHISKTVLFPIPEKTVRVEEFSITQATSLQTFTVHVKDAWITSVTSQVRNNLKDVKKGWFNIEESNYEVYNFSKLRKFLHRLNFNMEDIIRDLFYRNLSDYCHHICSFCPDKIDVISSDNIVVVGANFPLHNRSQVSQSHSRFPCQVHLFNIARTYL